MAVEETSPHGLKKYTAGTDPIPGRVGHNQMIDLMNQIPGLGIGPLSSRPAPSAGLRFWVEESTNRLSVNIGTSWAGIAEVGAVIPSKILVGSEGGEGSSSRSARADHAHELPLASLLGPGAMSAEFFALLAAATWQSVGDTLVRRTAAGNVHGQALLSEGAQSSLPQAATRKDYVDTKTWSAASINKDVIDPARLPVASPVANGAMSAADKAKLDVIPTIGQWVPCVVGAMFSASPQFPPHYRITGDKIEFKGAVSSLGSDESVAIVQLPASTRPPINRSLQVFGGSAEPIVAAVLRTDGSISFKPMSAGRLYYLENFRWYF